MLKSGKSLAFGQGMGSQKSTGSKLSCLGGNALASEEGCVCVCVCVCVYTSQLLYPFFHYRHLVYFCILGMVNNAAMNIGIHVSF